MRMKYKIVGDSSCDITKQMEEEMNIAIAPLTFTLDDVEYVDDDNLDLENYLRKIDQSSNVPKSACPSIQDYLDHFEGDHEWVFGVTLSSELSGSYNSAMNAKTMYLEKYPEKKVHIFNSRGASTMEVLIALKVHELVEAGEMSFEEIVDYVEAYIEEAKVLFVLDKIDTLEKNGRMSSMKAKIVRALNLKLILKATPEGTIDMVDKARGTKKALAKMVNSMPKVGTVSNDKILAISHCNALERAEYVKELASESYDFKDIIILKMRGLSSTYANEGGIIISF
jgi:DegV family protein with EDD domain